MLAQLLLQACVLAAIAVLSYVGDGWGYLLVYAFLLLMLAIVTAGLDLAMRLRGLPAVQRGERRTRALRSFALAEAVVAVGLVVTAGGVRRLDHPIGMFPVKIDGSQVWFRCFLTQQQTVGAGLQVVRQRLQLSSRLW